MSQADLSERNRPLSVAEQSLHFLDRVHIGPPPGPIRTAAAWRSSDFDGDDAWIQPLGDAEIAAFDAAIAFARLTGKPLDELGPEDFPLPSLSGRIEDWRRELETGRGFLVLRGAPADRWDQPTASLFMRGLGLQFGRLGVQNPQGDVIGEVRDTGAASRDSAARKYATSAEFRFHCDASDLVGLMCIRQARSGGESRIASSVAVYNEIRQRRPDLADRLFGPVPLDLRNEQAAGAAPYADVIPCAFDGATLRTFYISDYFRSVDRHGVQLPPALLELMDLYEQVAADPAVGLAFKLRPGDIQILNNHVTLHARSAFEDEPGRERLLLRFLVSVLDRAGQ
jgi:hypothetical protein